MNSIDIAVAAVTLDGGIVAVMMMAGFGAVWS